jgi:hypothetical protein
MKYSLVSKLIDLNHLIVLRDWIEFLHFKPTDISLYTPFSEHDIQQHLQLDWGDAVVNIVSPLPGEDIREGETQILHRLVLGCKTDVFVTVNLDTLPYRAGHDVWFEEIYDQIFHQEVMFFTGCGLLFRKDIPIAGQPFLKTQRFSNNFAVIRKDTWLHHMYRYKPEQLDPEAQRYFTEWAIEEGCHQDQRYGLRRYNSSDWRVFHVQQWDEKLLQTREKFQLGKNIQPYFNRYFEDQYYPWYWYYNYPKPSLLKLARIKFGAWRRKIGRE